jgi:hypothetical protein
VNEAKTVPSGVRRTSCSCLVTLLGVASALGNLGHGYDFATKATQGIRALIWAPSRRSCPTP